mmetsp:Transcript_25081/g.76162  ORF Transcript_25081/g.76162 Transcript_25081/m.76162 type:complete len:96 (+) Transcript_25081:864-1151(+)
MTASLLRPCAGAPPPSHGYSKPSSLRNKRKLHLELGHLLSLGPRAIDIALRLLEFGEHLQDARADDDTHEKIGWHVRGGRLRLIADRAAYSGQGH